MRMKEKMSIGEFAKLKNISQETLRHYDRIGLLKPQWTDETTGYRFYSIFQYEILSTILELRELGMSLKEIKTFLEGRDAEKTIHLLEDRYEQLKTELRRLAGIEKSIARKLSHLKKYINMEQSLQYELRTIPPRRILLWNQKLGGDIPESYGFAELEGQIKQFAPIFAENRYGIKMNATDLTHELMFLFLHDDEDVQPQYPSTTLMELDAGKYACTFFEGATQVLERFLDNFIEKLSEDHLIICGEIVLIAQVDLSVVGDTEKILYEVQIPVKTY